MIVSIVLPLVAHLAVALFASIPRPSPACSKRSDPSPPMANGNDTAAVQAASRGGAAPAPESPTAFTPKQLPGPDAS
eukprot:2669892-Rhodomonas_salina.1